MSGEIVPKRPELEPDEDAMQQWEQMPKNEPSAQALPPATGGTRWAWALLGFLLLIVVLSLLVQST